MPIDISIYDNYTGAERGFDFYPVDGTYKMCDAMLVAICVRGDAIVKMRLQEYSMTRNTFMIVAPDTPFYIMQQSDDFHIDVLRIGTKFFEIADEDNSKILLERMMHEKPLNLLTERKTRMFHIIHSYLKVLMHEHSDKFRDMVVYEYIKLLFFEACHIMMTEIDTESAKNKKEQVLTNRFFNCVEKNFYEQRKVEFYAGELGISAKHLAFTIKNTTGRHPSEWLDEYALLEAKKLLKSTDYTIQEISFDLHFSTPSHFSKFFKDKTGMTPKEFRKAGTNEINAQ